MLLSTPRRHRRGPLEDEIRWAPQTVSISFRVSPRFKALLEAAATHENRSLTNMLETLLFSHCEKVGIKEPKAKVTKAQGGKHA